MGIEESRPLPPTIHLALRFHTNFYHSYRGDTLDEAGIGKDIRIITSILDDLDRLNSEGVPVRGTWDIENYYSLEQYMPRHSPDLIRRLQERVAAGRDAVEPMSWNNGIASVCSPDEFDSMMEWTISNPGGSGLADLFESWEPVVRPQECMYTPSHLARYPEHGVTAISLYYATHPFNAFSNFMPPLAFEQQYNPLTLRSRDLAGEMTLLPAYNVGDLADHWLSLRIWLKQLRRQQMAAENPRDLLLLVDMDADDDLWDGMPIPVLPRLLSTFGGLYRMVRSLGLPDWLEFTTPGAYLADHERIGEVTLDHDTADGSFDGMSSWAEKWSNTYLWTKIQRARLLRRYALRLADRASSPHLQAELDAAQKAILLCMSTTHFGLASPVMNRARLKTAEAWCENALDHAGRALTAARKASASPPALVFPWGAEALPQVGRGALVRFHPGDESASHPVGATVPSLGDEEPVRAIAILSVPMSAAGDGGAGEADSRTAAQPVREAPALVVSDDGLDNGLVSVRASADGSVNLFNAGRRINCSGFPRCAVRYGRRIRRAAGATISPARMGSDFASLTVSGAIPLDDGEVRWTHRYLVVSGLPYIYVDALVAYPETANQERGRGFDTLGTWWDSRWREVMPWEFSPELDSSNAGERVPLTIWKHNFFGDVTRYDLNYAEFSRNRNLDSFNNHVTNGWVAVSGPHGGVLLAQSCLHDNSFAFCPMRLRQRGGKQSIFLNPFGTYHGEQLRYQTAATGIGRFFSLRMSDHLESYAPSYNGRVSRFSLMLAAYAGGRPDEGLQADAMLFAEPPIVI